LGRVDGGDSESAILVKKLVIQEFLMAREVHIYCGNARVDDQFFRDLLARAADMELLTVEIADLVQTPDLMRRWPALPLVIERHVDR